MEGITFDGQDAELVFHGRMLPVSLLRSKNCTLKNFSIDFEQPHITQASVVTNDTKAGQITLELAPWVQYEIAGDTLYVKGEAGAIVLLLVLPSSPKPAVWCITAVMCGWSSRR